MTETHATGAPTNTPQTTAQPKGGNATPAERRGISRDPLYVRKHETGTNIKRLGESMLTRALIPTATATRQESEEWSTVLCNTGLASTKRVT